MSQGFDSGAPSPVQVGYVIKMFPRLSETFILNEVLELERQELSLRIFSLKRPVDKVFHEQTRLVRSPISYLPEKPSDAPLRVALGQFHVWRRYRRPWGRMLRNTLQRARAGGDSNDLMIFCQACCLIRELGVIRHLHAHYANLPAKVALLVHRITGISYSITTHAKDIFQNDPFTSPKLHDRMCRASFVVANSQFSAHHIRTGLNGQGEIRVVHNGLDLEAFPQRQTLPEKPLILAVGRLVEKKGFGILIAACQLLKQKGVRFACEIVGTGAKSSQLKEEIRKRDVGELVTLTGPLPQHVLREHYAGAMVFALPCVCAGDGDRDILPNVIKEAMAVGVPVVTSRLEGIEELIEDGVSGLLVEPGDPSALAARLECLLTEAQLRASIATAGRQVIEERFDRRTNFAGLRELLVRAACNGVGLESRLQAVKTSDVMSASESSTPDRLKAGLQTAEASQRSTFGSS
jgi:glycosyltransferase involved in cell wall biosynthesis